MAIPSTVLDAALPAVSCAGVSAISGTIALCTGRVKTMVVAATAAVM